MASAPVRPLRVVVVGAGVTGLAVARRLTRRTPPIEAILLESSARAGGVIRTHREPGFVMEHGPDMFITNKPAAMELVRELGLEARLASTTPGLRRSFILRDGKLLRIPEGFYLMAPSSLKALAATPVLSWAGKLRMAAELFIPRRKSDEDESLGDFVRRRLGREALERIAQPMAAGITTADPERLSMQALMPQFVQMEREHGSVTRALIAKARRGGAEAKAGGPRYGLFASFDDGMQVLTDALEAQLPAGTLRLNAPVKTLRRTPAGWTVLMQNGSAIDADHVCLTTPAAPTARLLREAAPALADELAAIDSASCVTLNLVYRQGRIRHLLDGMGFVVPAIEKRFVMACSFSSRKFAGRCPDDRLLLRAFVGGALQQAHCDVDDAELLRRVKADLNDILGTTGEPDQVLITRWMKSMPQYVVGHLKRVERIEALVAGQPGLHLAGNAGRGVGIPDCIAGAHAAAERIVGV